MLLSRLGLSWRAAMSSRDLRRNHRGESPRGTEGLPWLAELNSGQRRAVTWGEGPLLIVAGAGSGKTRTLAYRVAYLIATGTPPSRILLLTFTRRAAEEMLRRAGGAVAMGSGSAGRVWGGTFHSVASRLIRMYGEAAGLDKGFTVMDRSDSEDLIDVIRHRLGFAGEKRRFPRKQTLMAIYSRCVNSRQPLGRILKRFYPWCAEWEKEIQHLFQGYVEEKQGMNVLDYDDLLLYWFHLLSDDDMARRMGSLFDHILVDEYQDTNRIQSEILRGMRRYNGNITVVGDDSQSIYGFRAATVRNILDFPKEFQGAKILFLEENYRSTPPILEATNRLIALSTERYSKNLRPTRRGDARPKLVTLLDEREQDEYVVERILEHYEEGIPLRRQAVLFRAAHLSDSLEVELARRNIPYHKYGGLRFLEASHVKDLVALLRIAENPRDELAWFRCLKLLPGVGPGTAARAIRHMKAQGGRPESLRSFTAPPSSREGILGMADLLHDLRSGPELPVTAQVERVRRFYDPLLQELYDNAPIRARDLESLESIASTYPTRGRFLTELQLDPPASTSDLSGPPTRDEDWLVLSTIHSSKGCEWDVVYLIHVSDGCLPSDMSTGSEEEIEEERRLAYVAMTRARDFLYVTRPLRYYHTKHRYSDEHDLSQLSRFLTEEVRSAFDQVDLAQDREDVVLSVEAVRDIQAKMRAMWG